ncbi:metaxin-2-like [Lineus longissimus]|uniref:metaxin-2-like n=1 Tax=Lineus longissimus TaxID=88925 RepID=UPI002B4D0035
MSLLTEAVQVEFGGREPWPQDVTLYQTDPDTHILLPDYASCLGVKAFLHMCGLNFQTKCRTNAAHMSPSGKMPFVRVGPMIVSEFEPIVTFVLTKGHHLSADSDEIQKAEIRAYISLVDGVLGNAELYITWYDPTIADEITKPRFGSPYPWPLNRIIPWISQRSELQKLKTLGWAEKPFDQVCDEVTSCCAALSEKLGNQDFFFGNKPTELDASVYGHLYALLTTDLPNKQLPKIIGEHQNLIDFCRRVDSNYFNGSHSTSLETSLQLSQEWEDVQAPTESGDT